MARLRLYWPASRRQQVTGLAANHGARWLRATRWRQTSSEEAAHAEAGLLGLLKHKLLVKDVPVGPGKQEFVHVLESQQGQQQLPNMVMMPGYAAGTGFFWRNFDALSEHFKVFAVDWLGTGLSGRPKFHARSRQETEDFFLSSLNTWQAKQGVDKFILVGHSLGGYLAAAYALRHPEQVQHLVLVCPAGIPRRPDNWESRYTADRTMRSQLYKLARSAWESGVTPGSVIRALGPWGPGLVEKYVTGRFSHHGVPLAPEEASVFKDYFYSITAAPGSGEFALRHLLAPGAWAYAPLEEQLSALKVPITFIYGESDWMDFKHAQRLSAKLDEWRPRKVVPDAGHFVFLEQPQLFNAALLRTCAPYLRQGAAEASQAVLEQQRDKEQRDKQGGVTVEQAVADTLTEAAGTPPISADR